MNKFKTPRTFVSRIAVAATALVASGVASAGPLAEAMDSKSALTEAEMLLAGASVIGLAAVAMMIFMVKRLMGR